MTIKDIAVLWKEDRKRFVKVSSYSTYLNHLNQHILPVFGNGGLPSENEVQKFALELLNKGFSLSSVQDTIMVLKMIVQFGARQGAWNNPRWTIKYPTTIRKSEIQTLTRQEHCQFMRFLKDHLDEAYLGIYICLSTGLRIGEICGLQWKDVNLCRRVLSVNKTYERIYIRDENGHRTQLVLGPPKTAESRREIPLSEDLMDLLSGILPEKDPESFLLSNSPKPMEPRTLRNHFYTALRESGTRKIRFHGMRHSFATRCIEFGCDYKTVSAILGHSNIATTLNLYVHPNMEQKMRCIETVSFSSLGDDQADASKVRVRRRRSDH